MGNFSDQGYQRERIVDWQNKIEALYYSIFGSNIDLSADTMDGQLIGALAEMLSNQDQIVEAALKVCDPNQAAETWLSTLAVLNGITRNGATYSTATVTFTGTNGVIIPEGAIVSETANGEKFATDEDVTIASGTASVLATALNSGAVIATAGTITEMETQIVGVTSVTNANDATIGREYETDSELRIRRLRSVAVSSVGLVDSVYAALADLDDVASVLVKENKTDATDGDGIPPHSVAAIVSGGDDTEIATAILLKKSIGCDTYGSTTETVYDSQGEAIDISFSRPTGVDIYIDMDIRKLQGFESTGEDDIKAAIIEYFETDPDTRIAIGGDVIYSQLYIPIMVNVPGVSVVDLTVGITAAPTGKDDIAIAFDELAAFDTSRITITDVT